MLASGADPNRRLLYVHGGGFAVGSPKSHRSLTAKLSQLAGSPATLQTWPHMVHVWQLFGPELEETREALEEISLFFEACAPRTVEQVEQFAQ